MQFSGPKQYPTTSRRQGTPQQSSGMPPLLGQAESLHGAPLHWRQRSVRNLQTLLFLPYC